MKQFPLIAHSLASLHDHAHELNDAMNAGEDINYLALHDFKHNLDKVTESFQTLVRTRKSDASTDRPE